jgi:heme/copper-type cytochrome/quinol oxidase subunit 2
MVTVGGPWGTQNVEARISNNKFMLMIIVFVSFFLFLIITKILILNYFREANGKVRGQEELGGQLQRLVNTCKQL